LVLDQFVKKIRLNTVRLSGQQISRGHRHSQEPLPPGEPKPVDKEAINAKRKEERKRKKENR
jgi:hypothetical protein